MTAADDSQAPARVPCPHCDEAIVPGARKCKGCKRWLGEPSSARTKPMSRYRRSLTLIVSAVVVVGAVLISSRQSPVGDAPPLTPMTAGSSVATADMPAAASEKGATADAAKNPNRRQSPSPPLTNDWRARQLKVDVHPLDIAFSANGKSIYVSSDDASIREYELKTGKLRRMASVPAQGDRIRLLNDRYIAIIRRVDAAHIPIVDTQAWERDAILLSVGSNPADIIALPDGKTVVAASSRGKRLSWFDLATGRRLSDLRLPHAVRQLFLLRANDRPYVGAMGMMFRARRPAGAWIDLFDPSERPFGATRRSIAVGRDPRNGAVSHDRTSVFFADHVSNSASLLRVDATTKTQTVTVGQGPVAAFMLTEDRFGVTIDSRARTATVIELKTMKRASTIMLPSSPSGGATTPDGSTLFVALGGLNWPPSGSGAAVIAGSPPKLITTLDTGKGAARVATAADGRAAAVANYFSKAITIIEQAK